MVDLRSPPPGTCAGHSSQTERCAARGLRKGASITTEAIHVVPLNDLREHNASADCWCKPTEEDEWPGVWVHHSMDKREEYEQGRMTS